MKRNVSIKWKTVLNVKVCLRIFDMNCVAEDITKFGGLTNILIWNKTKLFGADFTDKQNMKKNRTKIQQTVFSLRLSSAYKRKYLFRNGETRKVWSEEINLNAKTATKHVFHLVQFLETHLRLALIKRNVNQVSQ